MITVTQVELGKNKESCPRTGDIDEGGQGAPQKIGVHRRFTYLCGQDLQINNAIPQGPASDHLWIERGTCQILLSN